MYRGLKERTGNKTIDTLYLSDETLVIVEKINNVNIALQSAQV